MSIHPIICCFRGRRTPSGPFSLQELLRAISVMALLVSMVSTTWAGPLPAVHDEQDLGKRLLGQPVVVYNRPYTAPCFADYVPRREEVNNSFAMAMARNEYEPMQVGLYVPSGAKALRDIHLEVQCDIPSKIGYIYYIPKEELSWTADIQEDRGKPWQGKRAVLPMFVIPKNQMTSLEPGRSGAFWITFKTDEKLRPGDYQGKMEVYAAGKLLQAVPFVIKVYPFLLPR